MKKKLGLSLLAIALIVCMLSVGLVACKKKNTNANPKLDAVKAIVGGVQKSVADGDMTDLKVDGTLGIKINDDAEYQLKLALDLNLLQYHEWNYKSETTFEAGKEYFSKKSDGGYESVSVNSLTWDEVKEKSADKKLYTRTKKGTSGDSTHTWVDAELKDIKNNKTILGLYYSDAAAGTKDKYSGNTLYLYTNTENGGEKKMAFPAPFIGALQKELDGQVDFSGINLQDEEIWGSLDEYLKIVASLAEDGKVEGNRAYITLNLATLLDADESNEYSLISLVGGLQDYLDALKLDLDATQLGTVLPAISITLSADLDGNGKATGLNLALNISEQDINIQTVYENNKKDFLKIDMTKALNIQVSLAYTIGTATSFRPSTDELKTYTKQNDLIDIALSADLYLSEELGYSIAIDKDTTLTIAAPAGYYTLSIEAAIDPWTILAGIKDYSFDGFENILNSITSMLDGVDSLKLELLNTKNKAGQAIDKNAENSTYVALRVLLSKNYQLEGTKYSIERDTTTDEIIKYAKISTAIVSGLPLELGSVLPINDIIPIVSGFIGKSGAFPGLHIDEAHPEQEVLSYTPVKTPDLTAGGEADKVEPKGDETEKILKVVGGYLLGSYLGINDANGDIFASFDSDATLDGMIPFSGYTKWDNPVKDPAYKYYKVDTAGHYVQVAADAKYNAKTTYYTWVPEQFTQVDTVSQAFDAKKYYYTRSNTGTEDEPVYVYTYADIDEFEDNVAYYVYEGGWWNKEDLSKTKKFDAKKTYYTYVGTTYTQVAIADMEDNVDYYVRGYNDITYELDDKGEVVIDKTTKEPVILSRGDFGIDLSAQITVDDGIEIEATVKGMNIFNLSGNFSAKISNLSIKLFENNFPIFIDKAEGVYSTVAGKVNK